MRERARPKSASLMKHSELRRILLGWTGRGSRRREKKGRGSEGEGEVERERERERDKERRKIVFNHKSEK